MNNQDRTRYNLFGGFIAIVFLVAIVGGAWITGQNFVRSSFVPGSTKCDYIDTADGYNPTMVPDEQSEIVVYSPGDVANMIGHGIPIPDSKTMVSYKVTTSPSDNKIGWIYFTDGSSLAICNNSEDISVIHDGRNVTSFDHLKTTIKVLKSDDHYYAIWVLDGYGWCLNAAPGDSDINNLSNTASDLADAIIWN